MIWFEYILIVMGISLDIFAAMEIQGAMLAKVRKRALFVACSIVTVLQLVSFAGGYFICYLLEEGEIIERADIWGEVIAIAICTGLGIRLLVKAIKRELITETRKRELLPEDYIMIVTVTTCYTIAAGCASGFAGGNLWYMLLTIFICSIIVVVSGLYTGIHFGFQNKTVIYVIGAIMMWAAAADILFSRILHLYSF